MVKIIFIFIYIIHALVCCKCILLFYFWILINRVDFLNNKLLNLLFCFCLSSIKFITRLLTLIILWIFSLLKIFKINRHWFYIIFIFRVRKFMNLLIKLLLINSFLFLCLQLLSLIILNNIFLRFQIFKLIRTPLLWILNIFRHVLSNTLKIFIVLFLSLTIFQIIKITLLTLMQFRILAFLIFIFLFLFSYFLHLNKVISVINSRWLSFFFLGNGIDIRLCFLILKLYLCFGHIFKGYIILILLIVIIL